MRRPAAGLGIELPADLEAGLVAAIDEILAAESLAGPAGDASVRITVSRGPFFGRGLLPPDEHPAPTIVVQAWPVPPTPAAHLEIGLHLIPSAVRRDPENPLIGLKTTSRADYVYARIEARAAGADDALFLTTDGYLSEATSANLFIVRDHRLATPSLACAILPGTTRDWILRWGASVGLDPSEGLLTAHHLHEADEAFISSSVAGILPVTRFAGEPIGEGRPGGWTLRARADREAFIRGDGP
jgi:branched-subunit amino acid aminotransferase/4-amino-4-deoxychorismate lyase